MIEAVHAKMTEAAHAKMTEAVHVEFVYGELIIVAPLAGAVSLF